MTLNEKLTAGEQKLKLIELIFVATQIGLNYGLNKINEEEFKVEYTNLMNSLNKAL